MVSIIKCYRIFGLCEFWTSFKKIERSFWRTWRLNFHEHCLLFNFSACLLRIYLLYQSFAWVKSSTSICFLQIEVERFAPQRGPLFFAGVPQRFFFALQKNGLCPNPGKKKQSGAVAKPRRRGLLSSKEDLEVIPPVLAVNKSYRFAPLCGGLRPTAKLRRGAPALLLSSSLCTALRRAKPYRRRQSSSILIKVHLWIEIEKTITNWSKEVNKSSPKKGRRQNNALS